MNNIPKPRRLAPAFIALMLITSLCGLSGCGSAADRDGETPINDDTVRNHTIPIALAIQYTSNFRAAVDSFNKSCPTFQESMKFGHAEAFPADVFRKLMKQQNEKQGKAVGIRIYYGRDATTGEIKLVMVPYDSKGNDMIDRIVDMNGKPVPGITPAHTEALKVTSNGQAEEDGQRCPTVCDDGGSGLN